MKTFIVKIKKLFGVGGDIVKTKNPYFVDKPVEKTYLTDLLPMFGNTPIGSFFINLAGDLCYKKTNHSYEALEPKQYIFIVSIPKEHMISKILSDIKIGETTDYD